MSSTLLEKMRKVNKVLQTSGTQSVSFHDLSKILSEVLNANVYISVSYTHLTLPTIYSV